MRTRSVLLFVLALLAATPALAQDVEPGDEGMTTTSAPRLERRPALPAVGPTRVELRTALMPIDFCAGEDGGSCHSGPMPDRIRVIKSRCIPLGERDGEALAACRVTWEEVFSYSRLNRIHRNVCVRLIQHTYAPGDRPYWRWDIQFDERAGRACDEHGF